MVACTACVTYVMCAYVTLAVLAARIGIVLCTERDNTTESV